MRNSNIKSDKDIAMRVSTNSIIFNAILSGFKLFAGIISNSSAMVSDAVHSASDVFSTIIVMIGVNISSKEADEEHQYGHDRFECVAGMILACILFATGIGIGIVGIKKIFGPTSENLQIPGFLALLAAIISIIVKEGMYWYTRFYAKKINSSALMADAWHHRSDAMSSVGSFIGIFGARIGFPMLDPIASLVICLFIIKASYDIFKDSMDKMIDKSCDTDIINKMKDVVKSQDGVCDIDDMKTRMFGSKIYLDVEISVNGSISLEEAHKIAQAVHDKIEGEFPLVKHCMVHVNPAGFKNMD
ncbi:MULTISPECIES: cation diffusion facilitator family transporter [unclassified Romboutsia]|uniref:cation diffusion facilitator family transporter n=1 Tax=unclassified Romboutsia TaxID=2626894 RepID=UPI0008219E70|nr:MULTISPECIES: cation diffusion facilitator family transporter [unclassified Romboutsia]SCH50154.1 Ferrous-iron efflux pump FieF [uncultured Clostridium sp.]